MKMKNNKSNMGIISTIAGGVLGIGQSLNEMFFNSSQAEQNRDFQYDMMRMNQEYNSIGSQLQRAKEAGVNPNALLGGGYNSAVSTSPSGAQASYSSSLSSSLLSTLPDTMLKMAQVKKTESETDINIHNKEKVIAECKKIYSDIGVNDFNMDLQERTFSIFENKTASEIKLMTEQLNKLRNESSEILSRIDLQKAQTDETEAKTDLLESQKQGQDIENSLNELKKEFSDLTGIPLDAPESAVIFTLWQQGKFKELSDKFLLNDANASSTGTAGEVRKSASRIGLGIKEHKRFLDENPDLRSLYNPEYKGKNYWWMNAHR